MSASRREDFDDLALGITPQEEAAQLTGQLAARPELRGEYRENLDAVAIVARSAESTAHAFPDDRMEHLKARLMSAARDARQTTIPDATYTSVVPHDKLIEFGPGTRWAVLPGQGLTTVYWVFDPPACGDLPLESHVNAQSGYVLDGDFTLLYKNGSAQPLHAGDHYTIAPGVLHGATFQSRTVLCDVYEPAKDDFELLYSEQLAAAMREGQQQG